MSGAGERGRAGEDLALAWLEAHGLRCLARNFRARGGELDLVMRDGATLVFVEVRCRRDAGRGTAAETVTAIKRRRLIRAAAFYLQRHPSDRPCRFDVLAITPGRDAPVVEWIRDAFQSC